LADFNETQIFSSFSKILDISNLVKILPMAAEFQADRRPDGHKVKSLFAILRTSLINDTRTKLCVHYYYNIIILIIIIIIIFSATAAQCGLQLPRSRGFLIIHDTPQSVGLLWTSDQLVVEIST
jgi:hypothetical protein